MRLGPIRIDNGRKFIFTCKRSIHALISLPTLIISNQELILIPELVPILDSNLIAFPKQIVIPWSIPVPVLILIPESIRDSESTPESAPDSTLESFPESESIPAFESAPELMMMMTHLSKEGRNNYVIKIHDRKGTRGYRTT